MTDHPDITARKKAMRKDAMAARRHAHETHGATSAVALAGWAETLAPQPGAVVAGYWPMVGELDPRPLMLRLAALGCVLALPVVVERGRHLDFRRWAPDDGLEPGDHGTWHPLPAAPLVVPDVVLAPLLAFDRAGYRLGYGGGYYDRTLESLRKSHHVTTIGVGYAAQEVAQIPRDGLDQRLDRIATEKELIEVTAA